MMVTQEKMMMKVNSFDEKSDNIASAVEKCKKKSDDIVSVVRDRYMKPDDLTWTEVVKSKKRKKTPVDVFKPKDQKQKRDETESSIKCVFNPMDFTVNGMANEANGGVVIECDNDDNCGKLLAEVEKKLGDKYDVSKPKNLKP